MSSPLRSVLVEFGLVADTKDVDKAHNKVEGFIGTLKHLGGIVAEAFIFREVKEFVEGIVHTGVALEHMSTKTGVSIEKLQELEYAAKLSGVGAEELDTALARLSRTLVKAKGAKIEGIDTKDLNGTRTAADFLPDLADKFSHMTNASDRAALAMKLFGRGGVALVPLLAKGREGIKALTEEAKSLGGGFSEEGVKGAMEMEEASARLDFAFTGLKSNIAAAVLPILADLVTKVAHLVADFRTWTKDTKLLEAATTGFTFKGVVALIGHLGGLSAVLRTLIGLFFKTIVPILILEDFFVFMNGGKSLLGDTLDRLFGKGTAEKVRAAVQGIIDKVKELMRNAGPLKTAIAGLAMILGVELVSGAAAAVAALPALVTAFLALAPPLTAAALAAEGLIALIQQIKAFGDVTEGLGITGTIGEMVKQGTWDPFKAVNQVQNERARTRRRAADNELPVRKGMTVDKQGRPLDEHGEVIRQGKTVDARGKPIARATAPVPPGAVQNVHNEIKPTTNVMLPPGTDSQTVRRAGDAAADGALRSVRDLAASHASLVPQAGVTP